MPAVTSNGITFEIPDEWSYLILPPVTEVDGYAGVNFHVASMTLPVDDDSSYASATMEILGPLDVAFTLQEELPDSETVPGQGYYDVAKPENLSLVHFSQDRLQVTRDGQFGFLQPFTAANRAFHLYAVLGSAAAAAGGLGALNGVLASLEVSPA